MCCEGIFLDRLLKEFFRCPSVWGTKHRVDISSYLHPHSFLGHMSSRVLLQVGNYSPQPEIGSEGGPKRAWIASKARTPANSAVSMTDANAA